MPNPANDVVLRILAEKDHHDANPFNHSGKPRSISSLAKMIWCKEEQIKELEQAASSDSR
jgi:hypothetical protein